MKSIGVSKAFEIKRISISVILFQLYLLLLPFQRIQKIRAPGYIELFFLKMEYSDLILVMILLLLSKDIWVYVKERVHRNIVLFFVIIIICWILSAIHSGLYESMLDAFGIIMLISLFLVVAVLSSEMEMFVAFNRVNFFIGAAIVVFGLVVVIIAKYIPMQVFDIFFLKKYDGNAAVFMDRYCFLMKSPEMFITYLIFVLVSGAVMFEFDNKKRYYLFLLLIIISGVSALSRSLSGLFIVAALIIFYKYRDNIKYGIVSRLFVVLAYLFLSLTIILSIVKFETIEGANLKSYNNVYWTYDLRVPMGVAAIEMFKANLLIGAGPGNYTILAKSYLERNGGEYKKYLSEFPVDPHNVYLGLLAENGGIGFALFVYLFYGLLVRQKKIYVYGLERKYCNYVDYMCAGLIGLLVSGLFVDILTLRHMWVLMAMLYSFLNYPKLNDNINNK